MHLNTRIQWPRHHLDLTATAPSTSSVLGNYYARCHQWLAGKLARSAAARAQENETTAMAYLSPHLLSDIGCPAPLRTDMRAIRKQLRSNSYATLIH